MAGFGMMAALMGLGGHASRNIATRAGAEVLENGFVHTRPDVEDDQDDDLLDGIIAAIAERYDSDEGRVSAFFSKGLAGVAALKEAGTRMRFVVVGALTTEVKTTRIDATNPTRAITWHTADLGYTVPQLYFVLDGFGSNDNECQGRVVISGHQEIDEEISVSSKGVLIPWGRAATQDVTFTFTASQATDTSPIDVNLFAVGGVAKSLESSRGITRARRAMKGGISAARKLRLHVSGLGADSFARRLRNR